MEVIDSAAQVTVMDCDCWRKVMACEPVGEYISLRQVDGSSMPDAIIVPSVEITVGLYHTSITIYVTRLRNDLLLGMNFLLAAEAVLNLSDNTLSGCNSTVAIVSKK